MHEVCKGLRYILNTWKQDTHPRHTQFELGALLSLEVSVMVSRVVRGCSNWEVVSKGAWAVSLPHMVGNMQEVPMRVVVGLSSDEQLGEVFIMDEGNWS